VRGLARTGLQSPDSYRDSHLVPRCHPFFLGRTCLPVRLVVERQRPLCRPRRPLRERCHPGVRRRTRPRLRLGLGYLLPRVWFRPSRRRLTWLGLVVTPGGQRPSRPRCRDLRWRAPVRPRQAAWTQTPFSPGRHDASGAPPDVASSPAVMSFLESLRKELRADMAGAVETLTAGRAPGRLYSTSAGMGSSGNQVVTGGGGGDDGGTDGRTSGDSRRDRRSRRSRRSHRCRRPRSSSSDASFRSDGETVRRTLVDF